MMKPIGLSAILILYSSQAVRFCLLNLIIGSLATGLLHPLGATGDETPRRIFKDGQVIIGGFSPVFNEGCHTINSQKVGRLEAMIYAIEEINQNESLLTNVTLGYDIRDLCRSAIMTAKHAYQFATASTMNCKTVKCMSNHKCICDVNGTSGDKQFLSKNQSLTYPVIAIAGALPSRVALPLANFLQAVQIPYVGAGATSEELSSSNYDSFFRTVPSDANQAKAVADIIEHFGWRYVATIAMDDSYGRHGIIALERESFQRKTFCTELFGYIPLFNYSDTLKKIVHSLRDRASVRVIIVWGSSSYVKELVRVAAKEGLKNRVWIFSESFAAKTPEYLSSIQNFSSTGIHLGVKLHSEAPDYFLQNLQKRLHYNHSNEKPFWWKAFWKYVNSTKSPSHGSSNVSRNTLELDPLVRTAHDDYAVYMIDAIYSVAHAYDHMLKCKSSGKGTFSRENNLTCPDIQTTSETGQLIEYLKSVEFEGVTGKVNFDSRGDPVKAVYDIVYFNKSKIDDNGRATKNVIGSWNKSREERLEMSNVSIWWETHSNEVKTPSSTCADECTPGQWKVNTTECCWKCLPCQDGSISQTKGALSCTLCTSTQMSNPQRTQCIQLRIANIDWSDILATILSVASILGIVIDVCVFGILFYFRDTPMVRALNKVCSLVLLLGIALCFGMTLLYIVRPSSALCSVLKPLRYVVYTLCCSALFLKTMQIVQAFNISRHKNWVKAFICSTKRQVLVLSVMICIELLLGAGWILLDPPYAYEHIFPKSHVFITCVPFRGIPGKTLDSLMLMYLVLVAGCCIYYAYRARNLPANFNEAKHISFSLYIFMLSWITYYPVDYAAEGWYVAVLSGATLILSSYGLLGCIFGPKLFIVVWHPEKNTVEFIRAELRQRQSISNPSTVKPTETNVKVVAKEQGQKL